MGAFGRQAQRQDTIGTQNTVSDARYSYPKVTPGRIIEASPAEKQTEPSQFQKGRLQQSEMTEMTEMKQSYGKSMHAIESKPFDGEVSNFPLAGENQDY